MVSKARLDLPDPESTVTTTSLSRGISSEMFLRLCTRAPWTEMVVRAFETERTAREFQWRAEMRRSSLDTILRGVEETAFSMRDRLEAPAPLTAAEFGRAAKAQIARHPGLDSIEWLPLGLPQVRILRGDDRPDVPENYNLDEVEAPAVIEALDDLLQAYPPSAVSRSERLRSSVSEVDLAKQHESSAGRAYRAA